MRTKIATFVLTVLGSLQAATYYVSPAGSDNATGSMSAPFASFARGQTAAQPGDTVYFRAGEYNYTAATTTCSGQTALVAGVELNKSGTQGHMIHYMAYPGETPIFNFVGIKQSCRVKGIWAEGNWIHLKGLEITGVPQNNKLNHESWAVWVSGSFNIFEQLNMHHNMGPGLFIQKGAGNLGLNCDSHHNRDSLTSNGDGQSADGFGVHISVGDTGNVLRGCRAWMNSDDGFDCINAFEPVTWDHCIAAYSGYIPGTTTSLAAGNGNGFKAGGYGADPRAMPSNAPKHKVENCLAFNVKAAGFYANHHPVSCYFYDNTSYGSHPDFNMLGLKSNGANDSVGSPITVGTYRNNVAFGGSALVSDSTYNKPDDADNSWTLPVTVSNADFASLDTAGVFGPRKADGSIPDFQFMHLVKGSDLIGAGVDVGLPFAGTKPDLGAFPYATTSSVEAEVATTAPRTWRMETGRTGTADLITNLSWPAQLRIEIVDLAGHVDRVVCEVPAGPHSLSIPTGGLVPGMHLVHVEGPGFSQSAKIVSR
jgi:hypothetical protein